MTSRFTSNTAPCLMLLAMQSLLCTAGCEAKPVTVVPLSIRGAGYNIEIVRGVFSHPQSIPPSTVPFVSVFELTVNFDDLVNVMEPDRGGAVVGPSIRAPEPIDGCVTETYGSERRSLGFRCLEHTRTPSGEIRVLPNTVVYAATKAEVGELAPIVVDQSRVPEYPAQP